MLVHRMRFSHRSPNVAVHGSIRVPRVFCSWFTRPLLPPQARTYSRLRRFTTATRWCIFRTRSRTGTGLTTSKDHNLW